MFHRATVRRNPYVSLMHHAEAIVLAGGTGSRFGSGKLLAPYRGGALIDGALRAAMAAPVTRVVVVTGHDGEAVGKAVMSLVARANHCRAVEVIHAARYAEGMAETLKAGIAAVSGDTDGAFVFLADMPRIPPRLAMKLAESIGDRAAAAPTFQGQRGHPVLFSASLFESLLKVGGDRGARKILDDLAGDLVLVPVDDPGVLFDVDRKSDLAL
jgi:molybdenum cofactor cytidylyltransferase